MSQPLNGTTTRKRNSILNPNPILRGLNTVTERSEDNASTYGGIAVKTIFFLLFSVAGIVLQVVVKPYLQTGKVMELSIRKFAFTIHATEMWVLIGAVIAAIVFRLLARFIRVSTPVTGALFCITQGYIIAFLVFTVLPEKYRYLGMLALVITVAIILVMSVLYTTGLIRVTKKFKMVMLTLLITSIVASVLLFIGSFIPFTRDLVAQLRSNYPLAIIFDVVFIIIAALFLICDFDTIDHVVKDKLPKQYEWSAAFGLAFTVIWLYLKVLDLLMTIVGNSNSSKK